MMKPKPRQNGLTLTELVVVVAVAAILLGISVPTAKKLIDSLEHSAGARSLIDAALSGARAMAVSRNTPAGVRFQQDRSGDFYMIFILHDPAKTGLAQGFMAVPNRKPMKLPHNVGVLTGTVSSNAELDTPAELLNAQTFSIVFSERGQMIQFDVRVRNRDGVTNDTSLDPVFNTRANVNRLLPDPIGLFVQDDYPADGLAQESSVQSFYIYEKKRLDETPFSQRFTGYVQNLQKEFVNPYSGQLIKE